MLITGLCSGGLSKREDDRREKEGSQELGSGAANMLQNPESEDASDN